MDKAIDKRGQRPTGGRSRRWMWILGTVVVLIGGPVVYASLKLDSILNGYKDKLLPELSAKLGRPVQVGRISTTVLSGLGVELDELVIGGDPALAATVAAERQPLLRVGSVRLRVSALRAILSLGRSVRINELSVNEVSVQLIHYPDGSLNLDSVLARLQSEPPAEKKPLDSNVRSIILGLRIDELLLRDAAVHFTDLAPKDVATPTTVSISKINFTLKDFKASEPFESTLTAAVLAESPNFELRTGFGPLPEQLDGPPPLDRVVLKIARTELAPIAPFLHRVLPGVERLAIGAQLEATLGAAAPGGSGLTKARGGLNAWGVHFAGGKPFDVVLTTDVTADAKRGDVELHTLRLALGADASRTSEKTGLMSLEARGQMFDLKTSPRFEGVLVKSQGLDFDTLRSYYPALDKSAGVELHGGWSVDAHASGTKEGQTFAAAVDLTPASIRVAAHPAPATVHVAAEAPDAPSATEVAPAKEAPKGKGKRSALHAPSPRTKKGARSVVAAKRGASSPSAQPTASAKAAPHGPAGDLLFKPSGVALKLEVSGQAARDALKLQRIALQLADWLLEAHGTVKHFEAPVVELDATASSPGIGGLIRLLPPAAAAIPPDAKVQGALALVAHVAATLPSAKAPKGTMPQVKAQLQLRLTGANVAVTGARLIGSGTVAATASTAPGTMEATLDVDLDALEAAYQDVVQKRAGVPLWTKARFVQRGTVADPVVDVRIAELSAQAKAHLEGLAAPGALPSKSPPTPSFDATVTIPPFALAGVTSMLPSIASSPLPPLRVGAIVHARGQVGRPESFSVELRELSVRGGKSDLTATARIENLLRPRLELHATSDYLDLDELLPPSSPTKEPKRRREAATKPEDRSGLKAVAGNVSLKVKAGRVAKIRFTDLDTNLVLADGRATAKTLQVGVFGGSFAGSGSELDLVDDKGPFHLLGTIDRIKVEEALARFADSGGVLHGQLSATVDLRGKGTEPPDLQQTLTGKLSGSIDKASFVPLKLGDDLAKLLASKLPFAKGAKAATVQSDEADGAGGLGFDHLAGSVHFDAGTMTSDSPLKANTPLGPIELGGKVLSGGTLDLRGLLKLKADAASLLVGNLVTLTEPLPVELAITGPVGHPAIAVANVAAIVKVYLVAYAKGAGARLLGESAAGALLQKAGLGKVPVSTDEAAAAAKGKLDEAAAKGAAEAEQRTQAARQQAEAATKAATDRAREAASSQTQRASDAAKQAIKNSPLKGLFGR